MGIEYIDIVHHLHTDLGYTDHPLRARKLHAEFVGQAVEEVLKTRNRKNPFAWTCETMLGVAEWLEQADAVQRERFYQAVETGNLDIGALPFNVTPYLTEAEWDKALNWMPDVFYRRASVRMAMQNDINGFPAAAAEKLLDRGVRYLWMGPNIHLGAAPFDTPHAFRWKMADGRSLFVWLNGHYNNGFYIFNEFWREGPIPNSNDTAYRWPDAQDVFCTDDESLERAHAQCLKCMAAFEGREPNAGQFVRDGFVFNKITGVYPYRTLCLSLTNHWRMDNDPPILHIQAFVERWNEKGYKPVLRLTTATQAMRHIEEEIGDQVDVVEGEWPDWWANGTLATPRELGWSREAERVLAAAASPVLGEMTDTDRTCADAILRNLCLYNEHTYSNWKSVAEPYHFDVVAAQAEINILAYRALDGARDLLADRLRRSRPVDQTGVWIVNTGDDCFRGWISLPTNCLRGCFTHLKDAESGEIYPLEAYCSGGNYNKPGASSEVSRENETTDFPDLTPGIRARFWMPELKPHAMLRLMPFGGEAAAETEALGADIQTDCLGWPISIRYTGQKAPMIQPGFADFVSVDVDGFAPRWTMIDLFDHALDASAEGGRTRLNVREAAYEPVQRIESAHDISFVQYFSHPSLKWGKRVLTLFKAEPRGKLTLRMRRRDNPAPEIYYAKMQMAEKAGVPEMSLAGRSFRPGSGQIRNSCKDYYAIDGWVHYDAGNEHWLVASRDAAMVTFGQPNCFARLSELPEHMEALYYILFDNSWDTNFDVNAHGIFEFRFDLFQSDACANGKKQAEAMMNEPSVLVNLR